MTRRRAFTVGLITLLGAAAAIAQPTSSAQAYNTFHDHHLVYGVHNQHYWLDSSAQNSHPSAIPAGVKTWSDTTNTSVYYTRTYTKSESRLDFYRRSTSSNSYCAITAMYVDTTSVDPDSRNWWWGKVTVDPLLADESACGSSTHRKGIVAHEMGHAMGLAHNGSSSTVMYTYISSTNVNGPKGDDTNGINHLY